MSSWPPEYENGIETIDAGMLNIGICSMDSMTVPDSHASPIDGFCVWERAGWSRAVVVLAVQRGESPQQSGFRNLTGTHVRVSDQVFVSQSAAEVHASMHRVARELHEL
jgi:Iap family predicted aminopeptidase